MDQASTFQRNSARDVLTPLAIPIFGLILPAQDLGTDTPLRDWLAGMGLLKHRDGAEG